MERPTEEVGSSMELGEVLLSEPSEGETRAVWSSLATELGLSVRTSPLVGPTEEGEREASSPCAVEPTPDGPSVTTDGKVGSVVWVP